MTTPGIRIQRFGIPGPVHVRARSFHYTRDAAEDLHGCQMFQGIQADESLADMVLVKNSRLSVQPVTEAEWTHICALGGL